MTEKRHLFTVFGIGSIIVKLNELRFYCFLFLALRIGKSQMAKLKKVENKENVFLIRGVFEDINFEEDTPSIIPFAKSNSSVLYMIGLDDVIGFPKRQVSYIQCFFENKEYRKKKRSFALAH